MPPWANSRPGWILSGTSRKWFAAGSRSRSSTRSARRCCRCSSVRSGAGIRRLPLTSARAPGTAAWRNWPPVPPTWRSRRPSPLRAGPSARRRCTGNRSGSWCITGIPWLAALRARVADIRHEPFVAMGSGYGMRSLTDALFREAGFRPRIAFESQDSHTARGLVSAGLGVSILPPGGSPRDATCPRTARDPTTAGRGGWRFRWIRPWLSARSASRGGNAASTADAEPDPVRLFRELVLRDGPSLLAGFVRERSGS